MPGRVEAATVDHGLRPESAGEAALVADICAELSVPHRTLRVALAAGNLQAQARLARYQALNGWLAERGLGALATAHHVDDQAETLLMRLNRGSGVRGLAGVRAAGEGPTGARLLRPLLGWRRVELEQVCAAARLHPVTDPSNGDERFDRARIRRHLAAAPWLDPAALARSAANLAAADEALDWAAAGEWQSAVALTAEEVRYRPAAPQEIRLRVLERIVRLLANEGTSHGPRGGDIARLLLILEAQGTATLAGVRCRGGPEWRFRSAPPRRG